MKIRNVFSDLAFRSCLLFSLILVAATVSSNFSTNIEADHGTKSPLRNYGPNVGIDAHSLLTVTLHDATAFWTAGLCLVTAALVVATVLLWIATRRGILKQGQDTAEALHIAAKSAHAAEQQAKAARQSLIQSNRAWMKADLTLGDEAAAIIYNAEKEDFIDIYVPYRLENIGNAVALQIRVQAWAFFPDEDDVNDAAIDKLIERKCESVRYSTVEVSSYTMFPHEVVPAFSGPNNYRVHVTSVRIDRKEYNEACARRSKLHYFIIFGSISYKFPTDSDTVHQTRFVYNFSCIFPNLPMILSPGLITNVRLDKRFTPLGWYAD